MCGRASSSQHEKDAAAGDKEDMELFSAGGMLHVGISGYYRSEPKMEGVV